MRNNPETFTQTTRTLGPLTKRYEHALAKLEEAMRARSTVGATFWRREIAALRRLSPNLGRHK